MTIAPWGDFPRDPCDLGEMVAREVFLAKPAVTPDGHEWWPMGLPRFASSRNDAIRVICEICAFDAHRRAFDRSLRARLPRAYGGECELLMVATPDEICRAAIIAVRECGPIEPTSRYPNCPSGPKGEDRAGSS
jgi:hypothetical protein